VHLSPAVYQAARRNPADFNQAMRDWVAFVIGDTAEASGTISSNGIRGLETHAMLPMTTTLTDTWPRPTRTSLR
jgi:hypothetical protein